MKRLSLFGCTGSIGTQTLEVVRAFPGQFDIVALSANKNVDLLRKQIAEFRPKFVSVGSVEDASRLLSEFPFLEATQGEQGLVQMGKLDVDLSIMAITGFAALAPTFEAVKASKTVALANKESLVVAGRLLKAEVARSGCKLLPIDSEHNGLFQLLDCFSDKQVPGKQVETLVLTASGGPLLRRPELPLSEVTPEIAVKHPNWSMGAKISVDSATLMNKGLELVEASLLFEVPGDRIEVWVHPQSIVHAAIWLTDGTCLAQMGKPDMRAAIAHTLSHPERLSNVIPRLTLAQMSNLEFLPPDEKRFRCLALARQALGQGDGYLVALNAANEVAVAEFLARRLSFDRIPGVVERTLEKGWPAKVGEVSEIFELDGTARRVASSYLV